MSATPVFSACFAASDDTPPQPGWSHRRGRSRHRISWPHQVRNLLLRQCHFDVLFTVVSFSGDFSTF